MGCKGLCKTFVHGRSVLLCSQDGAKILTVRIRYHSETCRCMQRSSSIIHTTDDLIT